jgi:hypothetical protein
LDVVGRGDDGDDEETAAEDDGASVLPLMMLPVGSAVVAEVIELESTDPVADGVDPVDIVDAVDPVADMTS